MSDQIKIIDVLILQAIGGLRFNYRAGQVVSMPEEKAKIWIEKKLCKIADETDLKIDHPEDLLPPPPQLENGELPLDFPSRDLLIENGLQTLQEVREFGDYVTINGIGEKIAIAIEQYLLELDK